MLLITDLNDIPSISGSCSLTIGSFDGVHLGHQALFKHIKSKLPNGTLTVFTFSNHPANYFNPHRPTLLVCPPLQKVKYLSDYGADIIILIPFTMKFAKTTFREFLERLKEKLNFSYLALGVDATFGKNKEGDETNVKKLAAELKITVDYLPKTIYGTSHISSGKVRSLIGQAAFDELQNYLGRRYSLMGRIRQENGIYSFPLTGICLPPDGIYSVRIKTNHENHLARAHIISQKQVIEIDILETVVSLHGQNIEVIF